MKDGLEIDSYGTRRWYKNYQLHREDGPSIEFDNGDKFWHLNGMRHRVDGPAVEWNNGEGSWWLHGKLHRIDGPAIDQKECKIWFYHGVKIPCSSQEEFEKLLKLKAFW